MDKNSFLNYNPYDIIKHPILTNKSRKLLHKYIYTFEVDLLTDKIQIKRSIEYLFNVKVSKVNTMRILRKSKNKKVTSKKYFKKAIVTLKDGNKIDLFTNN